MKKQLSKIAIREKLRVHTQEAIANLIDLMKNSSNDNVRLGAVKILLAKVLPDLKAVELIGGLNPDGSVMHNVVILPSKKPLEPPPARSGK